MEVECSDCGLRYDDTYRLTLCPHESFEMTTLAVRGDGESKVCTSIEELDEFLGLQAVAKQMGPSGGMSGAS